jgi:hypothetical protein
VVAFAMSVASYCQSELQSHRAETTLFIVDEYHHRHHELASSGGDRCPPFPSAMTRAAISVSAQQAAVHQPNRGIQCDLVEVVERAFGTEMHSACGRQGIILDDMMFTPRLVLLHSLEFRFRVDTTSSNRFNQPSAVAMLRLWQK